MFDGYGDKSLGEEQRFHLSRLIIRVGEVGVQTSAYRILALSALTRRPRQLIRLSTYSVERSIPRLQHPVAYLPNAPHVRCHSVSVEELPPPAIHSSFEAAGCFNERPFPDEI
jgi:hypothetical protein